MDDKRAGRLADFLANLHDNGRKKIQGKQALAKYQGLMQSPAPNRHCAINYTRDNKASLRDHLFRFFKEPAGNTSVVLVHVDDKRDWVRFIRFVSKGGGDFNAETISLTGKGVEGFNGFGYRYEHPEAEGDEHNYFHVQPISETCLNEKIPGLPAWFSFRFPTFYMRAENSYELSIYAISSLCSWKELRTYQTTAHDDCWLLNHLIRQGAEAR
ncbi:hypothetical protein [Pseudomonas aeruginosa]|uniref:hypothetical protein n=1 Tax=Pseudomonas aeruginosa TaxID=287 RepID=UPI000F53C879|nr:hypothetical protein [Pseudomonas aeruginosa]